MSRFSKEDVLAAIRSSLKKRPNERLTRNQFISESGMTRADIDRYWDNWLSALEDAGADFGMSRFSKEDVLAEIRSYLHKRPYERLTRNQFISESGMTRADIDRYWDNWSSALEDAGADFGRYCVRIPPEELLTDWGKVARELGQMPTKNQYTRHGKYSKNTFTRNFGPWAAVPYAFRSYAIDKEEWLDVLELLPESKEHVQSSNVNSDPQPQTASNSARHKKLDDRRAYGDPIDFRGLRHAPVNEDGVILLFGMVARELGYLVESVQGGFPDCEAKRQIAPGKWQRVRIEFEFESRNFHDHNHDPTRCDLIVCWSHNWPACPVDLEVLELKEVIKGLSKSEE